MGSFGSTAHFCGPRFHRALISFSLALPLSPFLLSPPPQNPQSPPAFTVPAPASVTETRKSSSQPAAVPVKAAKAVEDIANQKTAPLNVILVLVAFVLGVLFARSAGL